MATPSTSWVATSHTNATPPPPPCALQRHIWPVAVLLQIHGHQLRNFFPKGCNCIPPNPSPTAPPPLRLCDALGTAVGDRVGPAVGAAVGVGVGGAAPNGSTSGVALQVLRSPHVYGVHDQCECQPQAREVVLSKMLLPEPPLTSHCELLALREAAVHG